MTKTKVRQPSLFACMGLTQSQIEFDNDDHDADDEKTLSDANDDNAVVPFMMNVQPACEYNGKLKVFTNIFT